MSETTTTHDAAPPGRPVRLVPTPPGFWRLVLGLCTATLAPLFGFLVGSIAGSPDPGIGMNAQYMGLFVGFVLGGLGLAVAFLGGRRMWFHYRERRATQEETAQEETV